MSTKNNSEGVSGIINPMNLLMPYAYDKQKRLENEDITFSHYTSADTAIKILRNKKVWLRNSQLMNDYSEVSFGHSLLESAWNSDPLGNRIRGALNRIREGLSVEIWDEYQSNFYDREFESFIICVSLTDRQPIDETEYGRLSMWRAYGGDTNVSLVFNKQAFLNPNSDPKVYNSPVLYADKGIFFREFGRLVSNLEMYEERFLGLGANWTKKNLLWAFHFAVLSTKHIGFSEEKEWRLIYSPNFFGNSDRVSPSVETVGGVPQKVYSLDLDNKTQSLDDPARLPHLLERILIGPTEFPYPIYGALVEELKNAGVDNAESKVVLSNIPLRK